MTNMYRIMSRRLDCVVEGCHASIEAETDDAIMAQVEEHVGATHPDLALDDATVDMLRSKIRDA